MESARLGGCVEEREGGDGEGFADVVERDRGVGGNRKRVRRLGKMDAVVEWRCRNERDGQRLHRYWSEV